MLFRFALYGFLKNQTYFEPFLVLAFLEKGLSFFAIGMLIGFREVVINIVEVPSGALADLHGRRRCMVISFISYILSFLVFALGTELWHLFLGMFFFGGGEAFRTGTHKAMILDWLRIQGRENERTRVYGYTRSWSKIGSAISVLIAAALVFYGGSYSNVFLFAIGPYVINLVNLATYPAVLDGDCKTDVSFREMARHLLRVTRDTIKTPMLRRLVAESMGFEGVYAAVKDYLQPVLKLTALSIPLMLNFPDKQRAALLVGVVYFGLHLLSSVAARKSHRVVDIFGGEEPVTRRLWQMNLFLYLSLAPLLYFHANSGIIAVFVLLAITQNLWRPVLITRFDTHSDPAIGATLLSIESQANSVSTMVLAPLLGLAVDWANAGDTSGIQHEFWPVALAGLATSIWALATNSHADSSTSSSSAKMESFKAS
ncbi:MAG: MFS transporter [Planctomycetes bacterium]|nr:MFS transporter [Planctomycetota bacterium]